MYNWDYEINREIKAEKKRWNGKVITTSKQWLYNDAGSREVSNYSTEKIWDAVRDYYDSRQWE